MKVAFLTARLFHTKSTTKTKNTSNTILNGYYLFFINFVSFVGNLSYVNMHLKILLKICAKEAGFYQASYYSPYNRYPWQQTLLLNVKLTLIFY